MNTDIPVSTTLKVTDLNKRYGEGPTAFEAIRSVTVSLAQGEFACLVGPSGSGKTTLLRCIAGLLEPTSGTVEVTNDTSVRTRSMAVVFQEYGRSLLPWMTVRGNVELPLRAAGVERDERDQLVSSALAEVGLSDADSKYPWQLSGGMQQRVAIARAVASRPAVLLMDEPFAAVDAQTRAELEDLVRRMWADLGMTILFVTHDIDESVYLAQRVLVLSSSPTVIIDDVSVDLPGQRDQLGTRSLPRFAELRSRVYGQIQRAKTLTGADYSLPD